MRLFPDPSEAYTTFFVVATLPFARSLRGLQACALSGSTVKYVESLSLENCDFN